MKGPYWIMTQALRDWEPRRYWLPRYVDGRWWLVERGEAR